MSVIRAKNNSTSLKVCPVEGPKHLQVVGLGWCETLFVSTWTVGVHSVTQLPVRSLREVYLGALVSAYYRAGCLGLSSSV